MTPLEITFEMAGGEVSPPQHPLHLDALLAYAMVRSRMDPSDPDAPTSVEDLERIGRNLPLELETRGCDSVWKASALHYEGVMGRDSRFLIRSVDVEDFARAIYRREVKFGKLDLDDNPDGDRKVNTKSGPYRSHQEFYPVAVVRQIKAWCYGDRDGIEDLLGLITHIGPYRRTGLGEVRGFRVEQCAEEVADRWVRRFMPWAMDGYARIYAACEAPYWEPKNRREAWCPPDLCMI